jgi:flagellar biosynthetic protein FliP
MMQRQMVCLTERRWWRHYGEMVLAMVAGMVGLGAVVQMVGLQPDGDAAQLGVMFATMTVGMDAWMLYRRAPRRDIVEMTVATNLPLAVFVPLLRADAISPVAGDVSAHAAMFVAMAAVMLATCGHPGGVGRSLRRP